MPSSTKPALVVDPIFLNDRDLAFAVRERGGGVDGTVELGIVALIVGLAFAAVGPSGLILAPVFTVALGVHHWRSLAAERRHRFLLAPTAATILDAACTEAQRRVAARAREPGRGWLRRVGMRFAFWRARDNDELIAETRRVLVERLGRVPGALAAQAAARVHESGPLG